MQQLKDKYRAVALAYRAATKGPEARYWPGLVLAYRMSALVVAINLCDSFMSSWRAARQFTVGVAEFLWMVAVAVFLVFCTPVGHGWEIWRLKKSQKNPVKKG